VTVNRAAIPALQTVTGTLTIAGVADDAPQTIALSRHSPFMLGDDFNDGNYDGWTMVDQGTTGQRPGLSRRALWLRPEPVLRAITTTSLPKKAYSPSTPRRAVGRLRAPVQDAFDG